jgi:diguanylate cyclase (GGDEF)-like protein
MNLLSLLGMSKEQVIGKDIPLLKDLIKKASPSLLTGSEYSETKSFHDRHFEVLTLPFRQSDGSSLIRIVLKDITNFIRLEKELLKRNKELIIINTLSSAFISSENMDLVMEDLIDKVLLITDFHTGWLMMNDDQHSRLIASRGVSPHVQKYIAEGGLDTLCINALKIQDPLYIVEPSVISEFPVLHEEGLIFLAAIPLISNNRTMGLLFLASKMDRDFDFDFAALLSLVGNHVSHIIDKIKLFQETKRLAITDGLTGLYNSRYFYKYLDLEIARTKRYGNSFSLVLFDIDDFKKLNDTYGHQSGDEVLQHLARILKSISRETDIVVRFGGEEFIIILPNTSEEDAIALAHRVLDATQDMKIAISDKEEVSITLSGGIASYPQNASSAKALLNAADNAMYAAKAAGKNTIICFQGELREKGI